MGNDFHFNIPHDFTPESKKVNLTHQHQGNIIKQTQAMRRRWPEYMVLKVKTVYRDNTFDLTTPDEEHLFERVMAIDPRAKDYYSPGKSVTVRFNNVNGGRPYIKFGYGFMGDVVDLSLIPYLQGVWPQGQANPGLTFMGTTQQHSWHNTDEIDYNDRPTTTTLSDPDQPTLGVVLFNRQSDSKNILAFLWQKKVSSSFQLHLTAYELDTLGSNTGGASASTFAWDLALGNPYSAPTSNNLQYGQLWGFLFHDTTLHKLYVLGHGTDDLRKTIFSVKEEGTLISTFQTTTLLEQSSYSIGYIVKGWFSRTTSDTGSLREQKDNLIRCFSGNTINNNWTLDPQTLLPDSQLATSTPHSQVTPSYIDPEGRWPINSNLGYVLVWVSGSTKLGSTAEYTRLGLDVADSSCKVQTACLAAIKLSDKTIMWQKTITNTAVAVKDDNWIALWEANYPFGAQLSDGSGHHGIFLSGTEYDYPCNGVITGVGENIGTWTVSTYAGFADEHALTNASGGSVQLGSNYGTSDTGSCGSGETLAGLGSARTITMPGLWTYVDTNPPGCAVTVSTASFALPLYSIYAPGHLRLFPLVGPLYPEDRSKQFSDLTNWGTGELPYATEEYTRLNPVGGTLVIEQTNGDIFGAYCHQAPPIVGGGAQLYPQWDGTTIDVTRIDYAKYDGTTNAPVFQADTSCVTPPDLVTITGNRHYFYDQYALPLNLYMIGQVEHSSLSKLFRRNPTTGDLVWETDISYKFNTTVYAQDSSLVSIAGPGSIQRASFDQIYSVIPLATHKVVLVCRDKRDDLFNGFDQALNGGTGNWTDLNSLPYPVVEIYNYDTGVRMDYTNPDTSVTTPTIELGDRVTTGQYDSGLGDGYSTLYRQWDLYGTANGSAPKPIQVRGALDVSGNPWLIYQWLSQDRSSGTYGAYAEYHNYMLIEFNQGLDMSGVANSPTITLLQDTGGFNPFGDEFSSLAFGAGKAAYLKSRFYTADPYDGFTVPIKTT